MISQLIVSSGNNIPSNPQFLRQVRDFFHIEANSWLRKASPEKSKSCKTSLTRWRYRGFNQT
ncbi:MAG: hypothetical protein ACTMUB_02305 [cyanobacterium endosymbiont of Rhopalodia musculus]